MAEPNATELEILKCLWTEAPLSAREIHDRVGPANAWHNSTTRTLILRMEKKGWLSRAKVHGVTVFTPLIDKVDTLGNLVKQLARNVFNVEGALPVNMFSASPHLSDEELDQLDDIINASNEGEEE